MKVFKIIFSLYIILLFFNLEIKGQRSINDGLVAYYRFNKDIATDSLLIHDETGLNHGKVYGNIRYVADRIKNPCGAVSSNGATYISVPNSKSLKSPSKQITISVWVKINNGSDFYKQWITICCKSNLIEENDKSPQYRMQATAQTVYLNTIFTEKVVPLLEYDKWYFYTYTFSDNKFKAYLNDSKFFEMDLKKKLKRNNYPLEIGRDTPGKVEYFYGAMDDLRIYNRALNDTEIKELYSQINDIKSFDFCNYNDNVKLVPQEVNDSLVKLPKAIDNIPVDYQKVVNVIYSKIIIYPYDNNIDDGDVITINLNGIWIRENYIIKAKVNNPDSQYLIPVNLSRGMNYFVVKAINEGKIPLNTLNFIIDDGILIQEVNLNSKKGMSGGVKILFN